MSEEKAGGSAFPVQLEVQTGGQGHQIFSSPGLTKLEWFAGMALQGMLSNQEANPWRCDTVEATERSFHFAKLMIAESKRRQP